MGFVVAVINFELLRAVVFVYMLAVVPALVPAIGWFGCVERPVATSKREEVTGCELLSLAPPTLPAIAPSRPLFP